MSGLEVIAGARQTGKTRELLAWLAAGHPVIGGPWSRMLIVPTVQDRVAIRHANAGLDTYLRMRTREFGACGLDAPIMRTALDLRGDILRWTEPGRPVEVAVDRMERVLQVLLGSSAPLARATLDTVPRRPVPLPLPSWRDGMGDAVGGE